METLKFKQIAVAVMPLPSGSGAPLLYGLTDEGNVYHWGGEEKGWKPLSMNLMKK